MMDQPPTLDYAGRAQPVRRYTFRTVVRAFFVASYAVMVAWAAAVTFEAGGFAYDDAE